MLRKIRIILATLTMLFVTLLFLDFTGTLHHWFGWLAKVQFLPAVLALNVVVVAVLLLLTLVFGRIYCSVICPLGIMQDLISWLRKKKNRFSHSPEKVCRLLSGHGGVGNLRPFHRKAVAALFRARGVHCGTGGRHWVVRGLAGTI